MEITIHVLGILPPIIDHQTETCEMKWKLGSFETNKHKEVIIAVWVSRVQSGSDFLLSCCVKGKGFEYPHLSYVRGSFHGPWLVLCTQSEYTHGRPTRPFRISSAPLKVLQCLWSSRAMRSSIGRVGANGSGCVRFIMSMKTGLSSAASPRKFPSPFMEKPKRPALIRATSFIALGYKEEASKADKISAESST